jgi:hypothetical protein
VLGAWLALGATVSLAGGAALGATVTFPPSDVDGELVADTFPTDGLRDGATLLVGAVVELGWKMLLLGAAVAFCGLLLGA